MHHKVVCDLWKICFGSCSGRMGMASVFQILLYMVEFRKHVYLL